MNYIIRKAEISDTKIINNYLTKLIQDEKKYDNNINENCIVHSFYENIILNDKNCILVAEKAKEIIGYLYGFVQSVGIRILILLHNLMPCLLTKSIEN